MIVGLRLYLICLLGGIFGYCSFRFLEGNDLAQEKYIDAMGWVWLALLAAAVAITLILSTRRHRNVFSPWFGFPLYFLTIYGLGSIRWLIEQRVHAGAVVFLALVGIVSYYLGTTIRLFSRTTYCRLWSKRAADNYILVLGTLGFCAAGLFYARAGVPILHTNSLQGRFEAYDQAGNNVLYLARLTVVAFLFFFARWSLSRSSGTHNSSRLGVAIFFACVTLFMFSTGSRTDLFFLWFTAMLIAYYARGGGLSLRLLLVAAAVLLTMFVYGYVRLLASEPDRADVLEVTARMYGGASGTGSLGTFGAYVFLQFGVYAENTIRILDWIPRDLPFFHGHVIVRTFATILPGKQEALGEYLKDVMNLQFAGGGINATMIGELYLDFGTPYVIAVMFFYGVLVRSLYDRLQRFRTETHVLLYAFCGYCLIVSINGGFFEQLSRFWYMFFISVGILLVRRRTKAVLVSACP